MKKSKVLVPAMALLLFSTAASITGTVAWFSSTRVFESEAGKFSVAQLEGNLACTVTDGTATTKNGDDINFDANTFLGDASFDAANKVLYTDVADTTTFRSLGAWALTKGSSSGWYYGTANTKIYFYAATWKYTFTYTFMAEQTNMNLYFDVNSATSEYFKADGTAATATPAEAVNTAQGFRMAFVSSTKKVVWAPFRTQDTSGDKPTIRYVTSTSSDGGTFSSSLVLLDETAKASATYALGTAADAKAATLGNCIGTFTKPVSPGDVSVEVEMTAWYEGTDPAIVTDEGTKMQQVSAVLPFTVRAAA